MDDTQPINSLPASGYMRLPQVLRLIPVSQTRWYEGIKRGLYPSPVKLGPRSSAWRVADIRELMAKIDSGQLL